MEGFGRVFYRWRRHRIKRKSGNIADFCRRWGSQYRYMVVLDADSVMTGECLTTLVRLMEANPTSGIIQTAPRGAGRDTLLCPGAAVRHPVYGPLFTAGLHYWQLGESHYWGHNAIIRIEPFMRHCALGRLSGRGPFAGEILSHDFVEAALMRRAGWKVWMAYDLPGSYEEMPPNLLDELKRDRRWCHGNLINARMFLWNGLHPAHRAVFMTGVMAYVSAPLWLLSLLLSSAFVLVHAVIGPTYFTQPRQLFPNWPEWDLHSTLMFMLATAGVLFTPKILGAIHVLRRGAGRFGGAAGLTLSVLTEMLLSSALAPVRMLFHTQFVLAALTNLQLQWKSPPREDAETTWTEAARRHGIHTLVAVGWGVAVYWLAPLYLWWLLPIVGALALAIPISVFSSRVSLGRALRRARMFVIPEEAEPPQELQTVRAHAERAWTAPRFVDMVVDPHLNALASAALPRPARSSDKVGARHLRTIVTATERGTGRADRWAEAPRADRLARALTAARAGVDLGVGTSGLAHRSCAHGTSDQGLLIRALQMAPSRLAQCSSPGLRRSWRSRVADQARSRCAVLPSRRRLLLPPQQGSLPVSGDCVHPCSPHRRSRGIQLRSTGMAPRRPPISRA